MMMTIINQNHALQRNCTFSICAVLCLETPAPPLETPWRRESRSLVAPRVEVPGDKAKTQKC